MGYVQGASVCTSHLSTLVPPRIPGCGSGTDTAPRSRSAGEVRDQLARGSGVLVKLHKMFRDIPDLRIDYFVVSYLKALSSAP